MNESSKIDELARNYGSDFTPDVEQGLVRLRSNTTSKVKVVSLVSRWMAVAASLLLLLSAVYFFYPASGGQTFVNNSTEPQTFELPDGSTAVLQNGSSLSIGEDFNAADRVLQLTGQAYFQVAHDATRPFLIANEHTQLRVTGTAFNLRVEDGELEVDVTEGSVDLTRAGSTTAVKAKQCGYSKAESNRIQLMPAAAGNRHAWRTGQLSFYETPLTDALTIIENAFQVDIDPVRDDCDFTVSGNFRSTDPAAILDNLAKLGGGELIDSGESFQLRKICD